MSSNGLKAMHRKSRKTRGLEKREDETPKGRPNVETKNRERKDNEAKNNGR